MRFLSACALVATLIVGPAHAGPDVLGKLHPIVEPDVIEWMKAKAGTIFTPQKLAQLKVEKQKAMKQYAERPPATSLPRTKEPATRWFDPSITVPYDLRDHEGSLIHAAGTRINPLDWRPLTRQLLFFDADDEDQVRWAEAIAIKAKWQVKPIIVSGPPLEIGRTWQHPVSFDQRGILVAKLGIQQLPAIVQQDGSRLRIDEVLP